MKISTLLNKKHIVMTSVAVVIIGVLSIPLVDKVQSKLGHSFIGGTLSGMNIYYKGKIVASVDRVTAVKANEDFSEIIISPDYKPTVFINGIVQK